MINCVQENQMNTTLTDGLPSVGTVQKSGRLGAPGPGQKGTLRVQSVEGH